MGDDSRKVVFLMGSGHCGSTLLDLILGSHSSAFSLGEFNRISSLVSAEDGEKLRICCVCEGECSFWNHAASEKVLKLLFSDKRRDVWGAVSRSLRLIVNPYGYIHRWSRKSVLVDSSKRPGWYRRQLVPSYKWRNMTPYLVYLLRDGRAVVNSYYRKYPERGLESIAENWKRQMLKMNSFYERFPGSRKTKICYEYLAARPEEAVREVCSFIGIEYEKEMLNYWGPEHHHVSGNAGTRSLIYKYREQFGYQAASSGRTKEEDKVYYDDRYYGNMKLAIRPDIRWKSELSSEQLAAFDHIAGRVNESIISRPDFFEK